MSKQVLIDGYALLDRFLEAHISLSREVERAHRGPERSRAHGKEEGLVIAQRILGEALRAAQKENG